MNNSYLSVKNLHHQYADGTVALKNISFDVAPKEFVVIIGLSGSGKTTLLRCLNHLITPTAGEIRWQNKIVTKIPREMAMIFQHFNLVPRLGVLTNVLTGGLGTESLWRSLLNQRRPSEIERATECLRMVGLADKAQARADQLSGGQQQRVAIARALYQRPELILADEPVASLDPALAFGVMRDLQNANQQLGLTVICNLHFLSLVREFASRVIALRQGELVYDGSPQKIDDAWFKKIYGEAARDLSHAN